MYGLKSKGQTFCTLGRSDASMKLPYGGEAESVEN